MRLNARILENVANVNCWRYANQAFVQEGQPNDIYIQLVDLSKNPAIECKSLAHPENPLRYMSQATAIALEGIFDSVDDAEVLTVAATQPFADDKSIWKIALTASQIPKSGNFKLKLTEDGVDRTFLIRSAIQTELLEVGSC